MALFKVSKGAAQGLSNQALGDGFCWFTYDDGKFYIDYKDPTDNVIKRKALNADRADKDKLGNIIQNTYAANLSLSGHTLKLMAKDGTTVLSTITLPDELVKQTKKTDSAEYKLLTTTSASPTSGAAAEAGYGVNLAYNPSLNRLSTGNVKLTGEIDVTGNATFHNQTQADSLTAGSLLVNGAANFVQSPTAPTPASTSNDTTVATTEFVKNNIAAGVTGVKGNAEGSYRVGNVNLTPANIGALALTGGTLTGTLNISVGSAGYADSLTAGGLNLNNSNIYGLNSIYTADASDNAGEGIHFYRDSTHVDTLWMSGGNIYFVPNRAVGTGTTAANSEKVTRLPASITSGRAVYTDGTTGKLAISATTSTELGYLSGVTSAIQTQLNAKAPLASPALTGTPTAPTAATGTNTTQIATTAFVTNAVAQGFVANDAMVFKGLIGSNQTITQLPTSGYNAGWTYRVANAGIFAGEYCEVGDLLIAINDSPTSGSSVINTDWGKVEHNIDGAVFRGSGASNSSVGSSTQPVYVNASGVVTAITGAIANDTTGNAATATTASKLSNTSKIGDTNKPVYFKADGTPAAISYTIDKSVPSNAVFTDRYVNSATFTDDSTNNNIKMTLTRAGSDTATVTANIPKVSSSSAGVAPKGAAVSSQSQTTKFLREDGTWAAPSYTTNTNTTYTFAEGSTNGTFSVTPSGGSVQSVLIHGLGTAAYKAEDYYVKRSGDTMSGSLQVINTANNTAGLKITLETQSYNFGFHMGTGGVNHGLYDFKASKWVVLGDASHNWTFNGNLNGKLTTARKLKVNLEATADTPFDGSADVLNIPTTGKLSTQRLARPRGLRGVNDVTLQALINSARANRLAFLPADQIIIEKTTDGGTTWVDAGVSDSQKLALFSEQRPEIYIPTLNGVRDQLCGLRITITAMKYNVPAGTPEIEKYNYWNSTYVQSKERYCQLKDMYFWLNAVNDSIGVMVQRATGANSTSWSTIFNDDSYYMTGWSDCDYINFSQNTFGGGTHQTSNYWNYRIILMTKGVNGTTTMATSSTTARQAICEIRAYGDTVWGVANRYMAYDHMYSFDANKNVTFPAKVTATEFVGNIAWNNITGKPSTYYTLPTAADNILGGIKTGYSASGKNYAIKVDSNGNAYVNVPWTDNNTTSFTITANATDGLWDLIGTNGTNAVTYALAPYSTKQSSTSFYTAATNPTLTTRLNYDGYFYATKLYSGGVEVLTSHQSLANYKTKQTAVSDPTASNTAIAFIDSISQDANGVIAPTKKTVRSASTSQTGVVQLSSATNSTSETLAATAKAVKTAYDLANTANTTANNHKYWANVESTSAASYNKAPEVASVKINGNTSASAASTKNVQLTYDSTLEVLNFVFS